MPTKNAKPLKKPSKGKDKKKSQPALADFANPSGGGGTPSFNLSGTAGGAASAPAFGFASVGNALGGGAAGAGAAKALLKPSRSYADHH